MRLVGARSLNIRPGRVSREYTFISGEWVEVTEQSDLTHLLAHPITLEVDPPLSVERWVRSTGKRRGKFFPNSEDRTGVALGPQGTVCSLSPALASACVVRGFASSLPLAEYLSQHPTARVVITRGGGLGDLLLLTPALAVLREAYPQAHLTLATIPEHVRILRETGLVDDCVGYFEAFASAPYDFHCDLNWYVENHAEQDRHRVDLFGEALGVTCTSHRLFAGVRDDERRSVAEKLGEVPLPLVGLQYANPSPYRLPSTEKLWRVGEALREAGLSVVPFSANSMEVSEPHLCGKLAIGELFAFIESCSAVVVGDSGPLHVASAVDTPAVGLFGMVEPATRVTSPLCVPLVSSCVCSPCRGRRTPQCRTPVPCLEQIPNELIVQSVLEAIRVPSHNEGL